MTLNYELGKEILTNNEIKTAFEAKNTNALNTLVGNLIDQQIEKELKERLPFYRFQTLETDDGPDIEVRGKTLKVATYVFEHGVGESGEEMYSLDGLNIVACEYATCVINYIYQRSISVLAASAFFRDIVISSPPNTLDIDSVIKKMSENFEKEGLTDLFVSESIKDRVQHCMANIHVIDDYVHDYLTVPNELGGFGLTKPLDTNHFIIGLNTNISVPGLYIQHVKAQIKLENNTSDNNNEYCRLDGSIRIGYSCDNSSVILGAVQ